LARPSRRFTQESKGGGVAIFWTGCQDVFADDGSDHSPIWTSSNSTVVQVSRLIVNGAWSSSIPSAVAYAAGAGRATITVWVAGRSASIPVTVTEAATNNP